MKKLYKKYLPAALLCLFFIGKTTAQPLGYSYGKVITLLASQVVGPVNFTDFTVMLKMTDPDLRSISNGGKVANVNGYDIIFTQNDCMLPLYHQIDEYNPVTGYLLAWVRVPLLSTTTDTDIQMYYGNSTVVAPTGSTSAWPADVRGVWHLAENPAGVAPQMKDGTSTAAHGTSNGGMTAAASVNAKIGKGLQFDEVNDYIQIPDINYTNSFTVSFWFRVWENSGTSYQYMFSHNNYAQFESLNAYFAESGLSYVPDQNQLKTNFQDINDATATSALDAGTGWWNNVWHYYTITVGNIGGATVYIDGVQYSYLSYLGGNAYDPPSDIFLGARADLNATRFLGGMLDEVHIADVPRSIDWIQTEYNNQNQAIDFFTVSPEFSSIAICSVLPIEMLDFEAAPAADHVDLHWITATEINNDYFTLERSADGIVWENIGTVDGAGTVFSQQDYFSTDEDPHTGTSYYRVRQTDFDGNTTCSPIRSVNFEGIEIINAWPVPGDEDIQFTINTTSAITARIRIIDALGRDVLDQYKKLEAGFNNFTADVSSWPPGVYTILITDTGQHDHVQQTILVR